METQSSNEIQGLSQAKSWVFLQNSLEPLTKLDSPRESSTMTSNPSPMKGENQIESRCDCPFECMVATHLVCRNPTKNEGQVPVPTPQLHLEHPLTH